MGFITQYLRSYARNNTSEIYSIPKRIAFYKKTDKYTTDRIPLATMPNLATN